MSSAPAPVPADLATAPRPATAATAAAGGPVVCVLAQLAPRLGDVAANLRTHLAVLEEARQGGAHLVVFPELSLTGYFLKDLVSDVGLRLDAPELASLAAACGDVDAVAGFVLESDDHRLYNASAYIADGRIQHIQCKVYLPTYGLFDEKRYLAAGERIEAFSAPLRSARPRRPWAAGLLVCEDLWHPSAPSILARDGMEMLIAVSASPGRGLNHENTLSTARSYDHMTRTYAQLFTSYVVYCNRVGYEDGIGFWGGSRVVGPDGELLGAPAGSDEALVWHRLDAGAVRRARLHTPLLREERHDINDRESDRLRARRPRY